MFHFKKSSSKAPMTKQIQHALDSLEKRLKEHIQYLAGEIGERNVYHPEKLSETAGYIQDYWQARGFHTYQQEYIAEGTSCKNLWVQIDGEESSEIVVVGAHYDSVWGSPGANDNASGLAALLEISHALKDKSMKRTIRFVAFVNEEPPFFLTDKMGSYLYAKELANQGVKVSSMICLETIGYYTNKPKSQEYPPIIGWFYPSEGNFIAVVGNFTSRGLAKKTAKHFQESIDFPIEVISAPRKISGVDWSDHASFWDQGYLAIMVTDTAPYRYPYYHSEQDLPDKITYPEYTKVVYGFKSVIEQLANE